MADSFTLHGFMPHGMCYLWRPDILWLHVISDAVIALSYFSIPAAMAVFALRRPDLAYRPVMRLFTAFIVLCGLTHAFSIWTVWTPDYFIEGLLKGATAIASLATAVVLWPLLPRALALPSNTALQEKNRELEAEIVGRAAAEAELQAFAADLEARVHQRTAELERANAALQQFATTASHDLRAPLRHIGLFAELVARDEAGLTAEGRENMARINTSVERLQSLVGVLLEYARLVHTPPNAVPMEPGEAARAAVQGRKPQIEAAGATVEIADLPGVVADPVLIERLFDNLISNALKYHHGETPPQVRIEARREGPFVEFAVTDDGPGIPAEYAARAFEMLRRLETRGTDGAGVGLAFCKTIVESHGGRMFLDTAHSPGARFVFTLPAA